MHDFNRRISCRRILGKILPFITAAALTAGMTVGCQAQETGALKPPSKDSSSVFSGKVPVQEEGSDEQTEALLAQLHNWLPTDNGRWSVYVSNLDAESEGMINSTRMQAASLIKLYIMGAVYEDFEALCSKYGQSALDSNLYSMITVSDNDAANTLVGYLGSGDTSAGMRRVNRFCEDHDYDDTSMGRLLLQSNEFGDNYTSTVDCGHFLKEVAKGEDSSFAYAGSMLKLLSEQTRTHKIPAQMPSDVTVANKTGELADVENDAAIIYNAKTNLVIVFMSENLSSPGAAQSVIASVSRRIYDYYNG